jgi:cation-transporting ATPase 13A1
MVASLATCSATLNNHLNHQIHTIRGGAKTQSIHKSKRGRKKLKSDDTNQQLILQTEREDVVTENDDNRIKTNAATTHFDANGSSVTTKPNLKVQAILLPRQTSFLVPLRFLSFLLINVTLNACMQTSGKPLEDAVRKLLNMPKEDQQFGSTVTPLHIYVAKKIASPSSLVLPPGHLPYPLPLLGLFLSIVMYVGGTVLIPLWNVTVHVLLNYQRYDNDRITAIHASRLLQNWYDENEEGEADPYYSTSKKQIVPAVLVYEEDTTAEPQPQTRVSRNAVSNKPPIVCPLFQSPEYVTGRETSYLGHPRRYYFELHRKRYYYDPSFQHETLVCGGPSLHEATPSLLLSDEFTHGLHTTSQVESAKERYGAYTSITIPVPTLRSAFLQRMTSPLIALQMIGRILSLIEEESLGRALANMMRLVFQHFVDSKRSVTSAITLAEEAKLGMESAYNFWVVRPKEEGSGSEWVMCSSPNELLPADVFFIETNENSIAMTSIVIPVDALLLDGTCVTEEAALTGETVPQAKMPLDVSIEESMDGSKPNEPLDMTGEHRSSCIFAGTKLLFSSNEDSKLLESLPPLPLHIRTKNSKPTIYLTLRIGSYSSRGEIIQAMMRSKMNTGLSNRSNEIDSMHLIGALTAFAVSSCFYLLLDSANDDRNHTSVFKRIVQCIRIIVASIPSDLPSSLAASEHACSTILRDEFDVVGREAGALVSASKTEAVVFDKTGTLTQDTQSLTSIVYPPCQLRRLKKKSKFLANTVLAGAHSLQQSDSESNLVGDPVDLTGLKWTGWKYSATDKSASSILSSEKLWQIRCFPFDPNKKMSSAIVLTKSRSGKFRLWLLAKGSPNKMKNQLFKDEEGSDLAHWYGESVKRLGLFGYRSISLGALDASNLDISRELFPLGLPNVKTSSEELENAVRDARRNARSFHRNDIEHRSLDFIGFACFTAPMRESTPRIVQELKKANIEVLMLTGDEPYASLACAVKAGITNKIPSKTHFLKQARSGSLVWESNEQVKRFSLGTVKSVERDVSDGGTLIVSGDAISTLLTENNGSEASQYMKDRLLRHVSVVASASPKDKYEFVNWLKKKKHVLMCGDGVNDIAAMTKADTSAAMLSGFNEHSVQSDSKDFEDARRKERLKKRRIGSNRLKGTITSEIEAAGIGDSSAAVQARIQRRILEGVPVIDALQEELIRRREIRKGGSAAAKIMEKEARLSKSMQDKAVSAHSTYEDDEDSSSIQTGEACLASSFTLLRPCISGIDSILRAGIAAAASGISTYRRVALNCILSSYNLATLYRNGLRYGKWMWQVELAGLIYTDRASFMAASTPRPRLTANIRPSETFNTGEVLSTLLQAIVHFTTLTLAVTSAKELQEHYPSDESHKGFGIKWSATASDNTASVGAVLASLTGSATSSASPKTEDKEPHSFFQRTPFQPNLVSNAVFFVSIWQNAVITLVNHSGKPFSISFLESRPLVLSVGLSFLLSIACLAETLPMLNNFIQLAPFPTKSSKVGMLRLLLFNLSSCYFIEYFSTFIFRRDVWKERNYPYHVGVDDGKLAAAADVEERLLLEERKQNTVVVYFLCLIVANLVVKIILC